MPEKMADQLEDEDMESELTEEEEREIVEMIESDERYKRFWETFRGQTVVNGKLVDIDDNDPTPDENGYRTITLR